jgi:hypothetical protein
LISFFWISDGVSDMRKSLLPKKWEIILFLSIFAFIFTFENYHWICMVYVGHTNLIVIFKSKMTQEEHNEMMYIYIVHLQKNRGYGGRMGLLWHLCICCIERYSHIISPWIKGNENKSLLKTLNLVDPYFNFITPLWFVIKS